MKYIRIIDAQNGDIQINKIIKPEWNLESCLVEDYYDEEEIVNIFSLKKELEEVKQQNKIFNNKIYMIKEHIDTMSKEEILYIIENYTGFWGKHNE